MDLDKVDLTQLDVVFGSMALLPKKEDIPEEFNNFRNKWVECAMAWFCEGIKTDSLIAKPDIDKTKALLVIQSCLASWEPKHEHKIAGVAYLLSQWFDEWKL